MPNVKCAESAPPAPYAGFAQYYDLLGWSEFSELVFPIITAFFEKINHTPASFLDLACGTGTLAHLLAAQKIKVLGLDICPEMIAIAQAKTCPDGYLPEFRQADITSFKLDRKFEMAGCFFDSVNHLPSNNAVKDSFRCVADHLASGGWYLFDLVTRRGLENWKDYYNSQEDTFYIAQEARFLPDQNCARVKIEAFIKDGVKGTIHIKEVFDEICIPLELIRDFLTECGFKKIITAPFPPADDLRDAERVMVYARI